MKMTWFSSTKYKKERDVAMLRENLELVENNILEALQAFGRDRSEVTLIAVSKNEARQHAPGGL